MADYRHKGFDLRSIQTVNMAELMALMRHTHPLPDIPRHRPVSIGTLMRDVKAIESKLKEQK